MEDVVVCPAIEASGSGFAYATAIKIDAMTLMGEFLKAKEKARAGMRVGRLPPVLALARRNG